MYVYIYTVTSLAMKFVFPATSDILTHDKEGKKLYIIFTRFRPETFINFNTFSLYISRVH